MLLFLQINTLKQVASHHRVIFSDMMTYQTTPEAAFFHTIFLILEVVVLQILKLYSSNTIEVAELYNVLDSVSVNHGLTLDFLVNSRSLLLGMHRLNFCNKYIRMSC